MARVWYAACTPYPSQCTGGGDGVLQLRLSGRLFVGAFARSSRRAGSSPLPSPSAAVAEDAGEGLQRRKIAAMFTLAYRLCLVYEGSWKTVHCVLQRRLACPLCSSSTASSAVAAPAVTVATCPCCRCGCCRGCSDNDTPRLVFPQVMRYITGKGSRARERAGGGLSPLFVVFVCVLG